ncbi:TetR/AcrR family transcriptional regulator [Microbacterium sp. G2-8]|uniref:TetR/AcrR family transcriptional regulator n=1 Tax=Microbacterium sp. G2-8 TaxID=2842454 RepID=UPI001C899CE0|nr:TetR/AcrR family transcriptional regulator [Microbacterium sp. G2-8]
MTTGERRTRAHGDERKQLVLDVATRLFSERGFNRVSIGDVASASGLSQAGLLHHFPSKKALLLAVLQERDHRRDGARDAAPHGLDFVTNFVETLEENERQPELMRLFAILSSESITAEHPAHGWFVARYEDLIALTTDELRNAIDTDSLPDGIDVETIAQWLIALADGLRQQSLLLPGTVDRVAAMRAFIGLLRPYLRRTNAPH